MATSCVEYQESSAEKNFCTSCGFIYMKRETETGQDKCPLVDVDKSPFNNAAASLQRFENVGQRGSELFCSRRSETEKFHNFSFGSFFFGSGRSINHFHYKLRAIMSATRSVPSGPKLKSMESMRRRDAKNRKKKEICRIS